MTRYRITVRGLDIELRGYVDGDINLTLLSRGLASQFGTQDPMIVASPAEDDYNPFKAEAEARGD